MASPTKPSPTRRADPTLWHDLAGAWLWPVLLRSAALSLRPARLGLAAVLVVLVALVARLPRLWLHVPGPGSIIAERGRDGLGDVSGGVLSLDHARVWFGLRELFAGGPHAAWSEFPWSTAAILVPILALAGVVGGAIARSTATELARGERLVWTQALAFALRRWRSLWLVVLGPVLLAGVLVLIMMGAGWLLRVPYLQVAAGALYPLALILSLACVAVMVLTAASLPMLVPAVVCEGTDAIDAAQRCYAYVLGRPVRVMMYAVVLLVQGVLLMLVLGALAGWSVRVGAWATTALIPGELGEAFREAAARGEIAGDGAWSRRVALHLVSFWSAWPRLLLAAVVVSFWYSAGSVLYLIVRRACDGQDTGELWAEGDPAGAVPGVSAGPVPVGDDDED